MCTLRLSDLPIPAAPALITAYHHIGCHVRSLEFLSPALCRLPGPLALVQTEAGNSGSAGSHGITHINGLSLAEIAASCPRVTPGEADGASAPLTCVRRGGVQVQALMVVAVHAGLLPGSSASTPAAAASSGGSSPDARAADAAAAEQRSLLRAAARLTWGLAGLVFELMHSAAGHWPSLGPVERQAVAGAALTQLFR